MRCGRTRPRYRSTGRCSRCRTTSARRLSGWSTSASCAVRSVRPKGTRRAKPTCSPGSDQDHRRQDDIYPDVTALQGRGLGQPGDSVTVRSQRRLSVTTFGQVLVGAMIFVTVLATVLPFVLFGRSPHVMYRPEQIDVSLDDVVGIDGVKDEVVRSLNLFLSHKTFAGMMGGTPRRGLLFEGAPGTGKTYTAKAMAAEAGVPFLFVSGTSFQSMFYGATAMKIRAFFKAGRQAALAHA